MADTPASGVAAPPASESQPRFTQASLTTLFGDEPVDATPTAPLPAASIGGVETPSLPATPPSPPATPSPGEPTPEELKQLDVFLKETEQQQASPAVTPPPVVLPASTPESARLQTLASDPIQAKQAMEGIDTLVKLELAASGGDMQGVLNSFVPQVQDMLVEHIYQANKEVFVQRFIDEHEGRIAKQDPRVARLESELQELRAGLNQEQMQRQSNINAYQREQRRQNYKGYWDNLFKTVQVTDGKTKNLLRGWTLDAIADGAESGDRHAQTAISQIQRGDYRPLGLKFREIYLDYIKDVKTRSLAIDAQRQAQQQNNTGRLGMSSSGLAAETNESAMPDFDADGNRKTKFWEKGLKALGLD